MWNLKIQQTSEYNIKEADSQIQRTNQWLPVAGVEGERGNIGVREWEAQTIGVRQAQGCIVQHGEYGQYFVIAVNGK